MHALQKAIEKRDIDALKKLADQKDAKNTVNTLTKEGQTLLISAIRSGSPGIVEVLLNAKANPNLRNKSQETPLAAACRNNLSSEDICRLLILHKADVNDSCESSLLPLVLAIESKNEELVQFLLSSNASVSPSCAEGDEVLSSAVSTGEFNLINLIINEYPTSVTTINAKVIEAAYKVRERTGSLEMLDFFLNGAGSAFEVGDKSALDSSLIYACNRRDAEALQYILDFGAEVNSDPYEIPPMHEAVLMGFTEGVRMMIERGADVNHRVPLTDTETFLSRAAREGYLETAEVLLEAKADPNIELKVMPLGSAVKSNNWPMVQLLLQHGADPDMPNEDGVTAKSLVQASQADPQILTALFGN